jgi:hypothetical protein
MSCCSALVARPNFGRWVPLWNCAEHAKTAHKMESIPPEMLSKVRVARYTAN